MRSFLVTYGRPRQAQGMAMAAFSPRPQKPPPLSPLLPYAHLSMRVYYHKPPLEFQNELHYQTVSVKNLTDLGLREEEGLIVCPDTGLRAGLFEKKSLLPHKKHLVLAVAGSNYELTNDRTVRNWITNLQALSSIPLHDVLVDRLVLRIKEEFPDKELHLTGHSAGGRAVKYAGLVHNLKAVAFGPMGLSEAHLIRLPHEPHMVYHHSRTLITQVVGRQDRLYALQQGVGSLHQLGQVIEVEGGHNLSSIIEGLSKSP